MSDKNAVLEYETRYLPIYFPKGYVCCDLCPAMETYARRQCRRTGEYLPTPGKHEMTVGMFCPLIIEEDDHGESDMRDG